MNTPVYPIDFNECIKNKRITDEQLHNRITKEIHKMISFMDRNKTYNHSISFEDVLIIIDRIQEDDNEYFEISVAQKHHRARIKVNDV